MLFKYFLDYLPEEVNLIAPSLWTVFRRERLSNKENQEETSTNLMDKLIAKTVEIALEEKLSTQKIKMQKLDTKQLIHLSLGIKRILQWHQKE